MMLFFVGKKKKAGLGTAAFLYYNNTYYLSENTAETEG